MRFSLPYSTKAALLLSLSLAGQPTLARVIINVPDDELPAVVKPSYTLNLYDLGLLEQDLTVQAYGELNIYDGSSRYNVIAVPHSTISLYGGGLRMIEPFEDYFGKLDHVTVNVSGGRLNSYRLKIGSGSALNVSSGHLDAFAAYENCVVNISGGTLDWFNAYDGSIINISGGYIGSGDEIASGSVVNITGGSLGYCGTYEGSILNLIGGEVRENARIGGQFNLQGGELGIAANIEKNSNAIFSSGRFGHEFKTYSGADLTLIGNSFMLDGVPVSGLNTTGNTIGLNIPVGSILTGSLSDGSVFIVGSSAGDQIADGTLTLQAAPIPATQTHYNVPAETAPLGLLPGQSLTLAEGGSIVNFFAAIDANVNITGGVAGKGMEFLNSQLTITGGDVGWFDALLGTHVDIRGGNTSYVRCTPGSTASISGGVIAKITAEADSQITVTGGDIYSRFALEVHDAGAIDFYGGSFSRLYTKAGASLTFHGGQFMDNGVLIEGLNQNGDAVTYNPGPDSHLTGILADGTVIQIRGNQLIETDTITLSYAATPPSTQQVFHVPVETAPRGLTAGQKVYVSQGGSLSHNFVAIDAAIEVHGGKINDGLQLIRSDLTVTDGTLGAITAQYDSHVTIDNGTFTTLRLDDNSSAVISGGTFEYLEHYSQGGLHLSGNTQAEWLTLGANTVTTISGGSYANEVIVGWQSTLVIDGGNIDAHVGISKDSTVIMNDGVFTGTIHPWSGPFDIRINGGDVGGTFILQHGTTLTIAGGQFHGTIDASYVGDIPSETAFINLIGQSFAINGISLTDDMLPSDTLLVTDRDVTLEGILADGSFISLELSTDYISDNNIPARLDLTITLVPEPATLFLLFTGTLSLLQRRRSS